MRQIKIVESFIQEIVNHSICSFLLSKCRERNFAVTLHVSSTGIDIYCLKKEIEIHWLPIQALVLYVVHFAFKKKVCGKT